MLKNVLGIRLLIWVGKVVPLPAPPWLSHTLQRAEVTRDASGNSGFQLTFSLSRDNPVDYLGLVDGSLEPFNRVIIGVLVGALPQMLIDGIITHQQVSPSDDPGQSTVTVTGRDVTAMMDLEEENRKYDNQPDSVIVLQILARYARYGLVPEVSPTTDLPLSVQRTPWQHETDLAFIQRLARRNSYVFYVEPIAPGVNRAYFGPDVRLGVPQPALTMNMGAENNLTSISFSHDPLKPVKATGPLLQQLTGLTLPLPELPLAVVPPMALFPTPPRRSVYLREVSTKSLPRALLEAQEAMKEGREAVTADGEVDTLLYGWVLRARAPVGVRGVGYSYDGFYQVNRVTHSIVPGKYTQSFSLSREGRGAMLPVVVP